MSHYEDEAQVEQLRRWWRENWMALAGGLVLGLAGIFGWEAWQNARTAKSEKGSQVYDDLKKVPIENAERANELGAQLVKDFAGTPYAAQAALLLAARAGARNDWDKARAHLEWAAKHADDPGLQKIARLRLARVLWQQGKADEALAQLDVDDNDAFAPLYQELRGDIQLARGDRAAARSAYEKALQLGPAAASREQLQRKLDDLAGEAPAAQAENKNS
jgi:predicted negative regulator of RcsB-dependent stress response